MTCNWHPKHLINFSVKFATFFFFVPGGEKRSTPENSVSGWTLYQLRLKINPYIQYYFPTLFSSELFTFFNLFLCNDQTEKSSLGRKRISDSFSIVIRQTRYRRKKIEEGGLYILTFFHSVLPFLPLFFSRSKIFLS